MSIIRLGTLPCTLLAIATPGLAQHSPEGERDLTQLSIEELSNVTVTSVSRRPPAGPSNLGNDADYQVMLRSAYDVTPSHELDLSVRHVAELPMPPVPDYTAVDLRFGWAIDERLTLSLRLQNLLDEGHGEFAAFGMLSEFERMAYVRPVWSER